MLIKSKLAAPHCLEAGTSKWYKPPVDANRNTAVLWVGKPLILF
jgi:hypothetical protein